MKKILLLTIPMFLFAQFSGIIHPVGQFRLSDNEQLNLPFRLAEFQLNLPLSDFGNWDFSANSALEYRWETNEHLFDLREVYLTYFPSFGEFKIGKQIHAWGAVDGNNPTDNLNAYDYYFMFLPGTERKIGSLSASANFYLGNWQIESVFIPEHTPNRVPINEADFPFSLPTAPTTLGIENPAEFGVRAQTSVFGSDFAFSYFSGWDRMFSLLQLVTSLENSSPNFGYRKTDVLGVDFVSFLGDFTFRGELGYFMTTNEIEKLIATDVTFSKLEIDAEYLQFVMQTEWTAPLDILLNLQCIGNQVLSAEGQTFGETGIEELTKDNFQPGMGTPFAMFSDKALLLSATGNLFDNRLELRTSTMFNLSETGAMIGASADYSPIENWNLELAFSQFFGDENSENPFTKLEDFSHISVGLKYSF